MVTVGSGHWGSTSWAVAASDTAGGRVCMTLRLGTGARSGFCGIVRRRAMRPGDAYGLTLTAGRSIAVSYVVGAVRSTARTVEIHLSRGNSVIARTIEPPRGLQQNIAFFAVRRPCGDFPTVLVARDAAGRIVARSAASGGGPHLLPC